MTCSRCGADAAIRRDAAYYCGRCAVARDWGEIIAAVQQGPQRGGAVVFDEAEGHDAETPRAEVTAAGSGDPFAS